MAIVTTIQSGLPGGSFFSGITINFGTPWIALTLTFNVLVTAMISTRLLLMQKKVRAVLGPEHTKLYTGVIAILIESALPFSLLSIAYIIPYARNDPESLALVGIWGCFCVCVSSFCILSLSNILRPSESVTASNHSSSCHGKRLVKGHDGPRYWHQRLHRLCECYEDRRKGIPW